MVTTYLNFKLLHLGFVIYKLIRKDLPKQNMVFKLKCINLEHQNTNTAVT